MPETPPPPPPPPLTQEDNERGEELVIWLRNTFGIDIHKELEGNDDWGLIVKLHAMLETALNTSIVKELSRPELESVIIRLDTSNPKIGKVAFAKALKIVSHDSSVFLQQLSELRNFCVHDIFGILIWISITT